MAISHICGCFIIQAKATYLNGSESIKEGKGEVSVPKSFQLNGAEYPYISSQCWRKWWQDNFKEEIANISFNDNFEKDLEKYEFLSATDDLFGYFKSIPDKIDPNQANQVNVSQIRSSPIQSSQLHPIQQFNAETNRAFSKDNAFVHLKDGTPLPYNSKFYSADLESLLSIDLNRIGFYRNFNDRQELHEKIIKNYEEKGLIEKFSDDQYKIKRFSEIKKSRLINVLKSLLTIMGGAKSTQYGNDITPKILFISGQNGANPILSNCFEMGIEKIRLNISKLMHNVKKFSKLFETPIYLGVRKDYIENEEEIRDLSIKFYDETKINLIMTSPIGVIKKLEEVDFI